MYLPAAPKRTPAASRPSAFLMLDLPNPLTPRDAQDVLSAVQDAAEELTEKILMFSTRRALSRRTMLRGVGATLALPFLDSMLPADAVDDEEVGAADAAGIRVLPQALSEVHASRDVPEEDRPRPVGSRAEGDRRVPRDGHQHRREDQMHRIPLAAHGMNLANPKAFNQAVLTALQA